MFGVKKYERKYNYMEVAIKNNKHYNQYMTAV